MPCVPQCDHRSNPGRNGGILIAMESPISKCSAERHSNDWWMWRLRLQSVKPVRRPAQYPLLVIGSEKRDQLLHDQQFEKVRPNHPARPKAVVQPPQEWPDITKG